jgi:hypothetical protein
MSNDIEREILRLVKEIKRDEMKLNSAMEYKLMDEVQVYKDTINRKIRLLEILKK